MAEIKSTLDIIMEKTKDMTLSEEEKRVFKQKEVTGKIKGLVQRVMDGFLDLDSLRIEITALEENQHGTMKNIVMNEIIPRIRIGEDNSLLLKIMGITKGIDPEPIRKMLADLKQELDQKRSVREKELLEQIKKRGISGSAVIPNVEADSVWVQFKSEKKMKLEETLHL